jgi:hypothetical protein
VWATSHALQPPSIVPRSMTGPCSVSHSTEPPPTYTKMAKVQLREGSLLAFVLRTLLRVVSATVRMCTKAGRRKSDRGGCYAAADPAVVRVNVSPSMTSQPCEAA